MSGFVAAFATSSNCSAFTRLFESLPYSKLTSLFFNLVFENKRVRKIFGGGTMYRNVPPHAWSPPNFPHSEITAKVFRSVSVSDKNQAFGSELKASMFLQRSREPLSSPWGNI